MICHPDQISIATRKLSSAITLHPFEIDDAWLRDTGPTFVCKNGALGGIDWVFNGWGITLPLTGGMTQKSPVILLNSLALLA